LKRVAKEAIRDMERNLILEALRANQWNRRRAAMALKISYRTLIYKIRDTGLISGRSKLSMDSQVDTKGASHSLYRLADHLIILFLTALWSRNCSSVHPY